MTYDSADGEERYPGNLNLEVTYTVDGNSLEIVYKAKSGKTTLWNPTNHTYFNLDGENSGDCRENILSINAEKFTPCNADLIPTGEIKCVKNTPFDFTFPKEIGKDFRTKE